MSLLQVRKLFRQISGRFDLVSEDGSDNGADQYINAGQKYLDRLDETQKSWGICYRFAAANFWAVQFPLCRAVKEVWVSTSTKRWQLEKAKSLAWLTSEYLSKPGSLRSTGNPTYYSPTIVRSMPDVNETPPADFEAFAGFVDVMSTNYYEYNSILFAPPADEKLAFEIRGLFYSPELSEDDDKSYWSEANPMILVMAAMRQIEVVNRNTQGVNDWTSSIMQEITGLGMDLVEELIAEADQMRG